MKTIVKRFPVDYTPEYGCFITDFFKEIYDKVKPRFQDGNCIFEYKTMDHKIDGSSTGNNERTEYLIINDRMVAFSVERRTEFNHIEIGITECIPDRFPHEKSIHIEDELVEPKINNYCSNCQSTSENCTCKHIKKQN